MRVQLLALVFALLMGTALASLNARTPFVSKAEKPGKPKDIKVSDTAKAVFARLPKRLLLNANVANARAPFVSKAEKPDKPKDIKVSDTAKAVFARLPK